MENNINNANVNSNSNVNKEIFITKEDKIGKHKNIIKEKKDPVFEIKSLDQKVNDYFSRFYFIKLDELGEDHENYGNIVLNGESHAPIKINLNYIMERAKEKEFQKIRHKDKDKFFEKININDNYSEFDFNQGKNKLIRNFRYSKLKLPLIHAKNKNKSMENLPLMNVNEENQKDILNKKDDLDNSFFSEEIKNNNTFTNINNINPINKKFDKIKNKKHKNKIESEYDSFPKLKNKILITKKNFKSFIQTNRTEIKTEANKKNHILKRNAFLKRYDEKESINKRLLKLNDGLIKLNQNIIKSVYNSDEDIPQFKLRFNNLINKFKNNS